ncbi:MAG: murein L,D-transpeptidase family protein [Pseudomonadota bacterium]
MSIAVLKVLNLSCGVPFGRLMCLFLSIFVLSGCLPKPKHLKPLSSEAMASLKAKGLKLGAPMFVRIFKQESEMEVWLQNSWGSYTRFKTYHVCRWSGQLGPKTFEGDKQAPEGFYVVTPQQMNPKSEYHLAFNLGYPNAYDRSFGYTGKHLMVHGGCSSAGCYAITDDAVQELYAIAREAFVGGQRKFPVHAFPFRMTDQNMAAHAAHRWYPFWQNLKEGYDMFAATGRPPVAGVRNGRYVFFPTQFAVPQEFTISAASSDPRAPRLISGWN